jgi:hypothetical protein
MQGPFPAKVINNNDTKKKGRIQIKIEHLHYGIKDSELPWAKQYSLATGGSGTHGKSSIPENNSYVWIGYEDIDELLRQPYYLADVHFSNLHPHNLFENNVKSSLGSTATYPNAKYTYYPNGICIGVDSSSSNPEIFLYHPQAFIFIDKTGNVTIKSGSTITQKMSLGENLSSLMSDIIDKILIHQHLYIPPLVPAAVTPILTTPDPLTAINFNLIKTTYIGGSAITPIVSTKIKNN